MTAVWLSKCFAVTCGVHAPSGQGPSDLVFQVGCYECFGVKATSVQQESDATGYWHRCLFLKKLFFWYMDKVTSVDAGMIRWRQAASSE